jgi:transcriptional regulator with XRE-family HTH domain
MDDAGYRRSVFPGFADIQARRQEMIDALVAVRRRKDLSQTAVAARMGTSQSAVARLESSAGDLRLSTLERYAAALDVRLEWRLEGRAT